MKKIKHTALLMLLAVMSISLANAQCPVPTGLSTTSSGATSAQLNWNAMTGASGYRIEVQNGQNNPNPFLVTGNTAVNTFAVSGLTAGFVYKFKVRTVCGGDKSNWSAWLQFVAGGGAINCVQLTGLAVSNNTSSGATFNWNASAGGLGYAVRVEDASGNPVNFLFNANTTVNSYTVSGLNPSSNYKVKIRKRCAPGVNGPWSAWVFFSTTAFRLSNESSDVTANEMTVSPVPAEDILKINYSSQTESDVTSVSIIDITGRKVFSKNYESDKSVIEIPVYDLPNGYYFVQMKNSTVINGKKIIVTH